MMTWDRVLNMIESNVEIVDDDKSDLFTTYYQVDANMNEENIDNKWWVQFAMRTEICHPGNYTPPPFHFMDWNVSSTEFGPYSNLQSGSQCGKCGSINEGWHVSTPKLIGSEEELDDFIVEWNKKRDEFLEVSVSEAEKAMLKRIASDIDNPERWEWCGVSGEGGEANVCVPVIVDGNVELSVWTNDNSADDFLFAGSGPLTVSQIQNAISYYRETCGDDSLENNVLIEKMEK